MRAMHAIYQDGKVEFPFHSPDYKGPVAILIVFPDAYEDDFVFDEIAENEIPY